MRRFGLVAEGFSSGRRRTLLTLLKVSFGGVIIAVIVVSDQIKMSLSEKNKWFAFAKLYRSRPIFAVE